MESKSETPPPAKRQDSSAPPPAKRSSTMPPAPDDPSKYTAFLTREGVMAILMCGDIGCALPIVVTDKENNPKEKDIYPIKFADEEYLASLKIFHKEEFDVFEEFKQFLEDGAGVTIDDIRNLDYEDTDAKNKIAQRIEKAIINSLECLSKYKTLALRRDEMAKFGPQANKYYENEIMNFLPNEKEYLSWEQTSINIEDNVGKLAVEFMGNGDSKMRAQAKLKFFLMIQLTIEANKEKPIESNEALSFLRNIVLGKMAHYHEGEDKAATFDMYLNTTHSVEDFRTLSFQLSNTEAKKEDFIQSKTISLRRLQYLDKNNKEQFIRFRMETRKKDLDRKTGKGLRRGESTDKHNDDNGARFVFESVEDAKIFETMLVAFLKEEYEKTLIKDNYHAMQRGNEEEFARISKKLESKRECILITGKEKEEVGSDDKGVPIYKLQQFKSSTTDSAFEKIADSLAEGKHEGHSEGSSDKFKVRKYLLDYNHPNGQTYNYEFQIMLFDGFVDLNHRKDVNTKEYHAKRAIQDKGGLLQLMVPKLVYPRIDLKTALTRKINTIRAGILEILAPKKIKATKAKEKKLKEREGELNKRERGLDKKERDLRRKQDSLMPEPLDTKKKRKKKAKIAKNTPRKATIRKRQRSALSSIPPKRHSNNRK